MAERRVTMRDIAAECGVSLATVSGALNYSGKESIRDEVRLRIIRTATRMHYRPSPRRERVLSAGIILNRQEKESPGKRMQCSDLAVELSELLRGRGFLPAVLPVRDLDEVLQDETLKKMDAWLIIDLDEDAFQKRLAGFYGPLLILESELDEPLYCKIQPDYRAVYERANAILGEATFLMTEQPQSRRLLKKMAAPFAPANVFVGRPGASPGDFLARQQGRKGIVWGDLLAAQAAAYFDTRDFVAVCRLQGAPFVPLAHCLRVENRRVAQAAAEALCAMLDFDYTGNETNHILIDPK